MNDKYLDQPVLVLSWTGPYIVKLSRLYPDGFLKESFAYHNSSDSLDHQCLERMAIWIIHLLQNPELGLQSNCLNSLRVCVLYSILPKPMRKCIDWFARWLGIPPTDGDGICFYTSFMKGKQGILTESQKGQSSQWEQHIDNFMTCLHLAWSKDNETTTP